MSGSGNSGTGAEPTPCHIHTHPTTNHTLHTQQAPRPRPRLFCPHSPICTQPTGTSRCPAPTRHLSLVPHPIYPNHQNPPRHIPAKRTQLAQPHPHLPHVHHAARPTPDAPTSHPHHSCAQNADHLTQNTPNSLNFTEVVCTLGAPIPNTANMETSARPTGIATVSVGDGAWPDIGNDAPNHTSTTCSTGMEDTEGPGWPGCGAGGRWQGLQDNEPTPTTHQHTDPTGVGSAGGSGGHGWPGPTAPGIPARQGCGARGRRQGLAGQRADTPSEARSADGSRAGRRPRAHQAARLSKRAGRSASITTTHRCGGYRRARAGFEARHRAKRGRLASRAAGPSGARNTRGA